ncbi:glycosyltransferase family 4 protein [Echinicola sp. CAU 1574]|uniref:Glycosyltransferase family 4 protein n=1 Tax=Echinicola arenosa TaxID=2774144 RepID=A0ABR9AHA4_9BACT|nr:glycosyltransferase family 4 protein [Echinicola arenosa]MBD8488232.1 glycosyltransferase family 4 protein [Echinicola arenosa]
MKVLVLYDYPPSPGGLSTQGDLLYQGLLEIGIDAHAVHFQSSQEKEWYYQWFKPDIVVGIGYWGYIQDIVIQPNLHGLLAVPWLVADGFIGNYREVLNKLPLILVTSNWVKQMYIRDGIKGENIEVLPVGCKTDVFCPVKADDEKVLAIRKALGVSPDQLMILTVGGDATSKGAQEVMKALAIIENEVSDWKYICKVWPQERTNLQNVVDQELSGLLGIEKRVQYVTNTVSRNFMPYLIAACDIYAAPSRLEGFGMPQVEAGACKKPVVGIKAMGMLDTIVHNKTGFLARVAQEIEINEAVLGIESGYEEPHIEVFASPRVVDYRADVNDIAKYLLRLMNNKVLRDKIGERARQHIVTNFDYRVVARKFVKIVQDRLGIN